MIFKKMYITIIIIIAILSGMNDSDFEKYQKLEVKNVASIKKSDLPSEFSDEAFWTVDEFIRKTRDIDYEILLFFDYKTGEILKCKIGEVNKVKLEFEEGEFKNNTVASIHNHHKSVYSPPSPKNFSIFRRDFENYELIAGCNELWILKGKIKDEKLYFELKIVSESLFNHALNYSKSKREKIEEIENLCDNLYGNLLLKYIINKNIHKIQLSKMEYKND